MTPTFTFEYENNNYAFSFTDQVDNDLGNLSDGDTLSATLHLANDSATPFSNTGTAAHTWPLSMTFIKQSMAMGPNTDHYLRWEQGNTTVNGTACELDIYVRSSTSGFSAGQVSLAIHSLEEANVNLWYAFGITYTYSNNTATTTGDPFITPLM